MSLRFKNHSPRAKWWDYHSAASYFITICTKDKIPYFGEFIIMPDHFHAILTIGINGYNRLPQCINDENGHFVSYNAFQPQRKNLGAVIRGFKGVVTVRARQICPSFRWHKLYHDVIIQDAVSYSRIEEYIRLNPAKGYRKENQ